MDLKLNPAFLVENVLNQLLDQMRHAKSRSAKMARLYIPLLVNWIQSMDVTEKPRDKANRDKPQFLDVALARNGIDWIRGIAGYEAVIWALAERILGMRAGRYEESRKLGALAKLQRVQWASEIMRTDKAGLDIPEEICSLRTQRRYRMEMISGSKIGAGNNAGESEEEN